MKAYRHYRETKHYVERATRPITSGRHRGVQTATEVILSLNDKKGGRNVRTGGARRVITLLTVTHILKLPETHKPTLCRTSVEGVGGGDSMGSRISLAIVERDICIRNGKDPPENPTGILCGLPSHT